jgi:hypothetical protein
MGNQATRPWLVWTVTALAALSLILVVINAVLASSNRSSQEVFYRQQQEINQGQQAFRLERLMTQRLAEAAVAHHDEELRGLLAKYNFTINPWPAAPAPNAPAAAAKPPAAGGAK